MVVIQDSREQSPFLFNVPTVVRKLNVGDYSICGPLEQEISIERKSADDLLGVITRDRERFERELDRAASLKSFWLLVETSWDALERGAYRSKASPNAVISSLLAWAARFPNLKLILGGNRALSQKLAFKILERTWMDSQK